MIDIRKQFVLKNSNSIEKHKEILIINTLPFKIKSLRFNNSDKNSIKSETKGKF